MQRPRPYCQAPVKTVVCPCKQKCVNTASFSNVNYVHPTHTTVMDQNTVQNTHYYPQSTSWGQTVNQTNVYGGQTWPQGSQGTQTAQANQVNPPRNRFNLF